MAFDPGTMEFWQNGNLLAASTPATGSTGTMAYWLNGNPIGVYTDRSGGVNFHPPFFGRF